MKRTSYAAALLPLLSLAIAAPVRAETRAAVSTSAAGGVVPTSIGVVGSSLRVASCSQAPCDLAQGEAIAVPKDLEPLLPRAGFTQFSLENGRSVLVASIVSVDPPAAWAAVVAPPLAGSSDKKPHVLFAGPAELVTGADAPLTTPAPTVIQALFDASHKASIVIGDRRDDIAICGRPTLLSPRIVDASDLALKPARVERFTDAERSSALRVVAARSNDPRDPPLAHLLAATGASSSLGTVSPSVLVDGDPETTWSEARGREGRGEFVAFRASPDVPITELSFTVRPKTRTIEHGAAPRRFWVASDGALVDVVLPEDAWQHPGATYDVKLPHPLATSCVAVVLEDAYAPAGAKDEAVTLAEVEARSALDGTTDLKSLAASLAAGGEKAKAAGAILLRGGKEARAAVASAYASLDDGGRMLALDVMDQAPCDEAAPVYVRALAGSFDAERNHARTRLERCRRAAVPALVAATSDPSRPESIAAAHELSLIAPEDAVTAIASVLDRVEGRARKDLRDALARAASNPKSDASLAKLFASSASPRTTLDLLRAAGPRLVDAPLVAPASSALARVVPPGSSFADRFVALAPASFLAQAGDAKAVSFLATALGDPDAHLRSGAARVAGKVASSRAKLVALGSDPDPRVREAVAFALRDHDEPSGRAALEALGRDEWTFVRSAAYDALAVAPADPAVDAVLVERLASDPSAVSLARAIEAVSKRNVAGAGPALRALADDAKRSLDVRSRAIRALGSVCDRSSIDYLADVVKRGASRTADAERQALAGMAAVALGRLHPADLASRLAPLTGEGSSRPAQEIAKAAMEEKDVCR